MDADRDQARQAVRLRPAGRHADLRAAGQPGQLARQLRDAGPAGTAPHDGPPRAWRGPSHVAISDEGINRRPDGKVHLVRVAATFEDDGRCHVRSVGAQGSHQLAATALSNALAVVPDGDGVPPGAEVAVVMTVG